MKYITPILVFLVLSSQSFAQILQPAQWSYDISEKEVRIGEELDLLFQAEIDADWYLYSSDFDPDCGPMVTTFTFEPHDSYELVGDIRPINPKEKFDEIFECDITIFIKKGEFRQTIKLLNESPIIKGSYEYQVCTDVDGKCIPFDDEFEFENIKVLPASVGMPVEKPEEQANKTEEKDSEEIAEEPASSTVEPAQNKDRDASETTTLDSNGKPLTSRDSTDPYTLIAFFFAAFIAGFLAMLTPCVFPMIPLTVTFFSGNKKKNGLSKALFYGLSIIVIYTFAGTLVAWINGPEFANWLSTHWIPNVFFFLIFFIFALSFLGLFDINLPSSFINKVDAQSDKGGYYGAFFMAFTLVLVSFSCTGPIVGSILVEAAGGQVIKPIIGMMGFSMAFAIVFTLFAIFPEWLSGLPKSGGWLNSVKVVLGFLELALGLKFLSVADQVYHWGLLDRDVYLVLWIVIFAMMGFYLLGKIKLPGDTELKSISVPRLLMSILTFAFVLYLIPGLFGAPLKAISGYLPPASSLDFDLIAISRGGQESVALPENCETPRYADILPEIPHGIPGYYDYEQAMDCAINSGKPIFIDFTGHGCVNCREMEAYVWSDDEVLKRLKNDFVMLALYVDDKQELPESEWFTSDYDGKVKKTIGKQNADFQIRKFNNNAQPFYVILDHEGNMLTNSPMSYNKNARDFIDFLDEGLEAFNQRLVVSEK